MKRSLIVLLLIAGLSPLMQSLAAGSEWQVDPAHSGIMFEIKHIFSTVRGHFSEYSAEVDFDPAVPEKSRFDFTVKTDSITTYIEKRDQHLKTADFFDTEKYPEMTFKSSKVTLIKDNRYLLEGKMTVKDVTKDMKVELVYLGQKDHPMEKGSTVIGLETRFTIDRLAFHVGDGKYHKMGVLGKDVNVLVTLEMTREK